jgi:signal transduction histidine kinase
VESVRAGNPPVRLGAVAFASQRMVEVSAVPFVAAGRASGGVVVAEDVTERMRVEQALLRSEKLAAIGRMSSQITHEVRNPLNSLSLNVEMLQEELGDAEGEARTLLGAIAKEIERLTEITEGYLGFARLPRPHLAREQVNPVIESLLRFVREEAESSGVRVTPELGEALPDVLADENQLRQALLNVVRNSLEAMRTNGNGRKGGTLSVATRKAGAQVEVIVRDDGPGISPKDLARIFDPFYSTKTEGTGLGLPLTQQIIEEHGGTIACASEPGRGTVFTIRLPAADGPV